MGAQFNEFEVIGTPVEVREQFYIRQADDAYRMGHEYSGGFNMASGIKFTSRVFNDREEARDWLLDNCEKWREALVVKVENDVEMFWLVGAWCAS